MCYGKREEGSLHDLRGGGEIFHLVIKDLTFGEQQWAGKGLPAGGPVGVKVGRWVGKQPVFGTWGLS